MLPWPNTIPSSVSWVPILGGLLVLWAALRPCYPWSKRSKVVPSPRANVQQHGPEELDAMPYPPDVLPGGRIVESPYGSIKVFEWGPSGGERVLLLHGISTPCLALGDVAEELVSNGFRVMLFDYFGRGYSDAPIDIPYNSRLYTTQILLVLASSSLPWTGNNAFHLIGYSLGGGVAVSFARYFPHMLRSLTLIAPSGLIRKTRIGWRSKLLYSTGIIPERLREHLVRLRLTPRPTRAASMAAKAVEADPARAEMNSDATGGRSFDNAALSRRRPGVTVDSVLWWQLRCHRGFVKAFVSSIRHAPIYEQREDWERLGKVLEARRRAAEGRDGRPPLGLAMGKVHLVLGGSDPIVVSEELVHDAVEAMGRESVAVTVLDGGHEIAITRGAYVSRLAIEFWTARVG